MGEFKTFTYDGRIEISAQEEAHFKRAVQDLLTHDKEGKKILERYKSEVIENSLPTIYTYLLERQNPIDSARFTSVLVYDHVTDRLRLEQRPTKAEQQIQAALRHLIISDEDPWETLKAGYDLLKQRAHYEQNQYSDFILGMDKIYDRLNSFKNKPPVKGYYLFGTNTNPNRLGDYVCAVATILQKNTAVVGPDNLLVRLQWAEEKNDLIRLQQVPVLIMKDFSALPKNYRLIDSVIIPLLQVRQKNNTITFIASEVDMLAVSKSLGGSFKRTGALYRALDALTDSCEINDFEI